MDTPQRLYGRRKGRPLRIRKSRLMEELLPRLKIDHAVPIAPKSLKPEALFSFTPSAIWLEIGFGGGEHLASQALQNPSVGFIGCEPFINGIASLLDHADKHAIQNVRIFQDDARVFLDTLPDQSVDRCFVLFPDPWPKVRHTARRFISKSSAERLFRVMKPGSELRLASDDPGMILWFREIMNAAEGFTAERDTPLPPPDWVETRYEQKALKAGRTPSHMIYRRA